MENYPEEFHHHKDVFTQFHTCTCIKTVSEVLNNQHTLQKQQEWESDRMGINLSAAAMRLHIDEDTTLIDTEIEQHLVDDYNFDSGMMHVQRPICGDVFQHCNILNICSEH
jgi:hypothetical protein